ncbi:nucleoside hydrolase [Erwinia sp. OLTSP20]|nr:nucleoside hydrolase [Erwinia sp. OAMSP11]PIJ73925.1 nucleoside hydrolase [Erwinia sp. OLSSP12]PIJ83933.1 nucleoside hydrolase [Erwinia sp. OLCASP19]PIJ86463.1 nucleoside hydrolase [Erwinia sp. OLMTSP26]PIJ87942.1 nucleoside hydrolase [Erwinia sp. OLMDSP33]PIJ90560.1 nucleoside hydrolase [Erwinia sp. OLFS4]PIJ93558.1 nucleoside hydrolase [Erwinia sp. OLTSP20]
MARPVIIDCDPGIDDAIALLTAFVSPELDILGITTVCGNQPLAITQRNALQIAALAGCDDIAVFAGCWRPLLRQPIYGQFHGHNGLGNLVLPAPERDVSSLHAVNFIIESCHRAQRQARPLTLCCLGPLTNLAVALRIDPTISKGIERVVLMGGAFRDNGNRTFSAEFNMLADPHAAHIVFSQDFAITVLPLDATHQVILTPDYVSQFTRHAGRLAGPLGQLMAFWDRNDVVRYGSRGGPLHDPLVIVWLLDNTLFSSQQARVFVEYDSPQFLGHTQADWYGKSGQLANASVVTGVNARGVFELMLARIARYGEQS